MLGRLPFFFVPHLPLRRLPRVSGCFRSCRLLCRSRAPIGSGGAVKPFSGRLAVASFFLLRVGFRLCLAPLFLLSTLSNLSTPNNSGGKIALFFGRFA